MRYKIFEVFGLELEYMVVDSESLKINPIVDQLLKKVGSLNGTDFESNSLEWSNELVRHVIEIKNAEPRKSFNNLGEEFLEQVRIINHELKTFGSQLMPTSMHPFMNPKTETQLWPLGYNEIYKTYDKLFNCKDHGWSNLQSMHVNLSFNDDFEFERLHSACRFILPLIPALTASSPIVEGKRGLYSTRLSYYLKNQKKVPAIMGEGIPDVSISVEDYHKKVLEPMYKEVRKIDESGVLEGEWLNSRGVIPKFERESLEIRLCDIQEMPVIDVAIAAFIIEILKLIVGEKLSKASVVREIPTLRLRSTLDVAVANGETAKIEDLHYLAGFGLNKVATFNDVFYHLLESIPDENLYREHREIIKKLLQKGSLSSRIFSSLDDGVDPKNIYRELCHCLIEGVFYEGCRD